VHPRLIVPRAYRVPQQILNEALARKDRDAFLGHLDGRVLASGGKVGANLPFKPLQVFGSPLSMVLLARVFE
jgi:hypothetical protein